MSILARTRKHKDALLHQHYPLWLSGRDLFVFRLEVSRLIATPILMIASVSPPIPVPSLSTLSQIPPHNSLPGAISTYALAVGISRLSSTLPSPVYALLSGLNAATVGIIALAAIQLSGKAISDKLTRILVFWGAAAGLLYNALWYFPLLMFVGGVVAVGWDLGWGRMVWARVRGTGRRKRGLEEERDVGVEEGKAGDSEKSIDRNGGAAEDNDGAVTGTTTNPITQPPEAQTPLAEAIPSDIEPSRTLFSWKMSVLVIPAFLLTFIIIMVLRGVLTNQPRGFNLFANLYLAGTYPLFHFLPLCVDFDTKAEGGLGTAMGGYDVMSRADNLLAHE